jgi:hypothetical protein
MRKKELAHRSNAGLEVRLLWSPSDDTLAVFVRDQRTGEAFELPVGDKSPLEVFYHPFAHAATRETPLAA